MSNIVMSNFTSMRGSLIYAKTNNSLYAIQGKVT